LKSKVRWRPLALGAIAALGLALRLYGLDWDQMQARFQQMARMYGLNFAQGNNFHPDERQIMFHVVQLAWPQSIAQFFDPATSPLNPHFFAYGSFPLYLLATIGNLLSHISPSLATFASLTITGRVLNALFDTGTILLTAWLAWLLMPDRTPERRYAWGAALLAAALVAFTPFQIQQSHFYTVDTMLLFFAVLTMLACVKLVETERPWRWAVIAGCGYGLAMATKFSAAPLAVPLLTALVLRWHREDFYSALMPALLSFVTTLIVFVIAMPYALLDFPEFRDQLSVQGDLARGLLDLPYVRQFAGTVPYLYEAQNMLLWGLGLMLGLAVCGGLIWLGWRMWKREGGAWLVVLSWIVIYGGITGSFYVKFMRYMLPIYPFLTLLAACALVWLVLFAGEKTWKRPDVMRRLMPGLAYAAVGLVLGGTMFQGLALLNVYSQPNTRIQASLWIYQHIKPGSTLTYEQWDDPLPVAVDGYDPGIYSQAATFNTLGQSGTGLDLYGDDTIQKAQELANELPTIDAITMASDRLDKSIPRLPARYPLTIHYYQLLFSGQLGFHLAAEFVARPNLLGITLDDSNADESYSVFDHPHVRIFVRDTPYPYTSAQLLQKLLQGVNLPPPAAHLSGAEHSLLLSTQQITDNQQSPPFGQQFPADSLANHFPVLFWWLALLVLGWLVFPLAFLALRGLADRGYLFSKTLGLIFLGYGAWILACLRIVAFSHLSMVMVVMGLCCIALALFLWQRRAIGLFLREHWLLLLVEEGIFTLALLAMVWVRMLNPDLWNVYYGGEKPMELAFLNAILRSPYMPPFDPWFAGGYINYYYFGYILVGALIKLTGIIPTVAFNLAVPTLFALTFCGVFALVYSLTRRFPAAFLAGYLAAVVGNFDGLIQLKEQLAAFLTRMPIPTFDYWRSSRVIPFTINEFPFWSFLFADLHPHVINMPITILLIGLIVALLLGRHDEQQFSLGQRIGKIILYVLVAFAFGTVACVNPWDMPVYGLLLGVVMLLRTFWQTRGMQVREQIIAYARSATGFLLLCGLAYLFYWPFYANYQQLYVNGLGLVRTGTTLGNYLTVFGFGLFLALSFLLFEGYRWLIKRREVRGSGKGNGIGKSGSVRWTVGYLLFCGIAFTAAALAGVKALLLMTLFGGLLLFSLHIRSTSMVMKASSVQKTFMGEIRELTNVHVAYLLLLLGLSISLGMEVVYVRDFLDGGVFERMNTVFKFSIPVWFFLAIGGALAVHHLWKHMRQGVRRVWTLFFTLLLAGCSVFLPLGTASRVNDHQAWIAEQPPVKSANYTPTLDGMAFMRAWYPGDAEAISWMNEYISGSPVILEAAAPLSYTWFGRVAVYTGLPDVLGWLDHEQEQRYGDTLLNRLTDIAIMYTTPDVQQAIALLHYYHVRYIYVGELERQAYAGQSLIGLDKFERMVGDTLRLVYRTGGVTIYEVIR
jgi:YYY domain-containing protein